MILSWIGLLVLIGLVRNKVLDLQNKLQNASKEGQYILPRYFPFRVYQENPIERFIHRVEELHFDYQVILVSESHQCGYNIKVEVNNGLSDENQTIFQNQGFGQLPVIVPNKNLKENSTLLISVSTDNGCQYRIHTNTLISNLQVRIGDMYSLMFHRSSTFIFHFQSPVDINSIDSILIAVSTQNIQELSQKVQVFGSVGQSVSANRDEHLHSQQILVNSQGIILQKNTKNNQLISNTTYSVMVEAPIKSIITISVSQLNVDKELRLNQYHFDIGIEGQTRNLTVTLDSDQQSQSETQDFIISNQEFTGIMETQIYINGDQDDVYYMMGYMKNRMVIKPSERKNKVIKYVKISINFIEDSTFKLDTQLFNSQYEYLSFGQSVSGLSQPDETIRYSMNIYNETSFYFKSYIMTYNQSEVNLYVMIRICRDNEVRCTIDNQDIDGLVQNGNRDNVLVYKTKPYDLSYISINNTFFKTNSNTSFHSYCVLLVNKGQQKVDYELSIEQKHIDIWINENQEMRKYLQEGDFQNFKFSLASDSKVDYVQIQISQFSGNQTVECQLDVPLNLNGQVNTSTHSYKLSNNEYNPIQYSKSKEGRLNRDYFIKVTADSESYFMIKVIVHRQKRRKISWLTNGFSQIVRTQDLKQFGKDDNHYYAFGIYLDQHMDDSFISLNMHSVQGDYQLRAVKILIDKSDENDKRSFFHTVRTNLRNLTSSYQYSVMHNGNTFIGHKSKQSELVLILVMSLNNKDGVFEIGYSSDNKAQELKLKHTYVEKIRNNYVKQYKLVLHSNKAYILEFMDFINDNQLVKVGLHLSEGEQVKTLFTNQTDEVYTVYQQDIQAVCSFRNNKICTLYVDVYNGNLKYFDYKVRVYVDNEIQMMKYGVQFKGMFDNEKDSQSYYNYLQGNESVNIQMQNEIYGVKTRFFVNIFSLTGTDLNFSLPTQDDHQYASNSVNGFLETLQLSHSQLVDKYSKKSCSEMSTDQQNQNCLLVVNLVYNQTQTFKNMNYTIIMSRNIKYISQDTQYIDYVEQKQMKYYKFESYCIDCSEIVISANPINDGDVDLYVNHFSDDLAQFPTIDKSDLKSVRYGGDDLIINSRDMKLQGFFYIGVYGFDNTTYSLYVTEGNFNIIRLVQNLPQNIPYIQNKHTVYMRFYVYRFADLHIFTQSSKGDYITLISKIDRSKSLASQLPCPDAKNYIIRSDQKNIKLKRSDKDIDCSFCEFIIAIVPNSDIQNFRIQVTNSKSYLYLMNGQQLEYRVEKDEMDKFRYVSKTQSIKLNIIVMTGRVQVYVFEGSNSFSTIETAIDLKQLSGSNYSRFGYQQFQNNQLNVEIGEVNSDGNDFYQNWVNKQFKIIVLGDSDISGYKISVSNGISTKYLDINQLNSGILKTQGVDRYLFNNYDRTKNVVINLQYKSQVQNNVVCQPGQLYLKIFSSKAYSVDKKVFSDNLNTVAEKKRMQSQEGYDMAMATVQVQKDEQLQVLLQFKQPTPILCSTQYYILMKDFDPLVRFDLVFLPRYETIKYMTSQDKSIFEVPVLKKQKVLIQQNDCYSSFRLIGHVADSRPNSTNKVVQGLSNNQNDHNQFQKVHIQNIEDMNSLHLEVSENRKIQGLFLPQNDDNQKVIKSEYYSLFKLDAAILKPETVVPYDQLKINDPKIETSYLDNNSSIKVKIETLKPVNKELKEFNRQYNVLDYIYTFVFSEYPQEVQGMLLCNIQGSLAIRNDITLKKDKDQKWKSQKVVRQYLNDYNPNEIEVIVEHGGNKRVYIGARVEVILKEQEDQEYSMTYYYSSTVHQNVVTKSTSKYYLFFVVLMMVLVLSIGIYFGCKKYFINDRLKYEVVNTTQQSLAGQSISLGASRNQQSQSSISFDGSDRQMEMVQSDVKQ